jgi:hypothetical protein
MKNHTFEDGYENIKTLLIWKNPNSQQGSIQNQIKILQLRDNERQSYFHNAQLEIKKHLYTLRLSGKRNISLGELQKYLNENATDYYFKYKHLEQLTGKSGLCLEVVSLNGVSVLRIPCTLNFLNWYKGEIFLPIVYYTDKYLINHFKSNKDNLEKLTELLRVTSKNKFNDLNFEKVSPV